MFGIHRAQVGNIVPRPHIRLFFLPPPPPSHTHPELLSIFASLSLVPLFGHAAPVQQRVIELGRTIRDRRKKPLKLPLKELIVVHSDRNFLDDIEGGCNALLPWLKYTLLLCKASMPTTCEDFCFEIPNGPYFELFKAVILHHGRDIKILREIVVACKWSPGELREYVSEELNVRSLSTCADATRYCTLRAEPNFAVLAPRLGKAVAAVTAAVKQLGSEAIMQYDKDGVIDVAGHKLEAGDIRVSADRGELIALCLLLCYTFTAGSSRLLCAEFLRRIRSVVQLFFMSELQSSI